MRKNIVMYCIAKVALKIISLIERLNENCRKFGRKSKPYLVAFSMFLAVGVSVASVIDVERDEPVVIIEHVVEKGESIWTIADIYWSGDTRDAVEMIREYNHLSSERIYPGQLLQVPVKMSDIDRN